MGGICDIWEKNSDGTISKRPVPSCTDNFQIVSPRFSYSGLEWYSVEQAFQALKFPSGSIARTAIHTTSPNNDELDWEYGKRVYDIGGPCGKFVGLQRPGWENVKRKIMLLLNLVKYASDSSFQKELIDTGNQRIEAQESTADWKFWNTCTQMLIRKLLHSQEDLHSVIGDVEHMAPHDVEIMLEDAHTPGS